MKNARLILGVAIILLMVFAGIYLTKSVDENVVTPGPTILTGTSICLPHRDTTGPQTMECAFGISTENGENYALSMSPNMSQEFQVNQQITVKGHLVPIEAISSDHWRIYDVKGIVQVEEIR